MWPCLAHLAPHSRESGNPETQDPSLALDARFRGHDGAEDDGRLPMRSPAYGRQQEHRAARPDAVEDDPR